MANVNKVTLIGRLTRDPEMHAFANGNKVANIGFAVSNRRKNAETGHYEEVPVWVELKAFNREPGRKLADIAEQHLRKGHQVYIEGGLSLDEWVGKDDGKKRSRTVVIVEEIQFLEKKEGGEAVKTRELEDVPF